MPENTAWVILRARPRRITYRAAQAGIPAGCTIAEVTDAPGELFYIHSTDPNLSTIPPPTLPQTLVAGKVANADNINAVPGRSETLTTTVVSAPALRFIPNPATTDVSCSITLPENGSCTLEILDALQRVLRQPLKEAVLEKGINTLTLSVADLPNGAYTARLRCILPDGEIRFTSAQLFIVK